MARALPRSSAPKCQLRNRGVGALGALALALTAVSGMAGHSQAPGRGAIADTGDDTPVAACAQDNRPGHEAEASRHLDRTVRDNPGPARPLELAHAHNDFEHSRPLRDALNNGFTSVEADVWLVGDRVMVAHDREDVERGRSLERMYLSPLERRRKQGGGAVYPGWHGQFQLLIDVKSRARSTYAALDDALRRYPRLLTTFTGDRTSQRAVSVVITGNRAPAAMLGTRIRYAALDGRVARSDQQAARSFMPLVSEDWRKEFTWDGGCVMPGAEQLRLRELVDTAHRHGRRVRFWGTPDQPGAARDAVWRMLVDVGVDEIATDDLGGLRAFLSR